MDNWQLELCPRFLRIWGLPCQRLKNAILMPIQNVDHKSVLVLVLINQYSYSYSCNNQVLRLVLGLTQGIKTSSGGVCCPNARGRVRNRKSNPEGASRRDSTYCSHKTECIGTTNPTMQGWGQFRFCNSNSNSGIFRFCNSNSNSIVYNSNSRTFNSNSNSGHQVEPVHLVNTCT